MCLYTADTHAGAELEGHGLNKIAREFLGWGARADQDGSGCNADALNQMEKTFVRFGGVTTPVA